MRTNRDSTSSGPTFSPPYRSDLLSKIHRSLKLKSCRYMDTGSNMPTTPTDTWTDLRNSRFLRHGRQLQQPTSWMAPPTQEILPKLRLTLDWTYVPPGNLKTTALRTLWSNKKRPSHLASTTRSSSQQPSHPTPKPVRFPIWSPWASTSVSDCANTSSAPATAEQSNSYPSWALSSSWGTNSSHPTTQSSASSMSLRSSSPWTTRRMRSEDNQSHTSDLSRNQPARFKHG